MEDKPEYTIYQNDYMDAINEEYVKPIVDIVDENKNFIHPTAIIGKDVILGKNNYIGANCYIVGNTRIGDNNHFEAFCSVGTFPEHRSFFDKKQMKGVVIGNNNVFREFITINSGCYDNTILGNNIWMLRNSHIGHDSVISDNCTFSCNVLIGGHSLVGESVNFGLGSICHQFSVIGGGSMIGMGCIITKKSQIKPLHTFVGNPAKEIGVNQHKLKNASILLVEEYQYEYDHNIKRMEEIKLNIENANK